MSAEKTFSLADCPDEIRQKITKRLQEGDKVLFVRNLGEVIYNAYVARPYWRCIISVYANSTTTEITPLGTDAGFIAAILEHDEEIAGEIKKRLSLKKPKRSPKDR